MYSQKLTAVTRNTTGDIVTGPCTVYALGIRGGADAATVVFRDGEAGPIRWSFGVGAGVSDGLSFPCGLRFDTSCHITVTGTTPAVHVAIANPQANQLNPS